MDIISVFINEEAAAVKDLSNLIQITNFLNGKFGIWIHI